MISNILTQATKDLIQQEVQNLIDKGLRPASEVILDDVDLRNLLKISRRTALKYRKMNLFPHYQIDNKIYYLLSEVIEGIKSKTSKSE